LAGAHPINRFDSKPFRDVSRGAVRAKKKSKNSLDSGAGQRAVRVFEHPVEDLPQCLEIEDQFLPAGNRRRGRL
jgi:hypothetical protein